MMNRTVFLLAVLACAAHGAVTNVVFVTIDDLSRESLGIHGCTIPEISPNLDALARSGLRFEHCHVQSANCTPSRNIMSSGLYQQRNRVFSLGKEGAGNQLTMPALPDVFRKAGYHTGLMGKNGHMSPFEPYSGFDTIYDSYGSTREPDNIYNKMRTAFADAASLGKPLYFNLNIYDPHTGWFNWAPKTGPEGDLSNPPSRIYSETEVPYPAWFPPMSEDERTGIPKDGTESMSMMLEIAAYYNTVKRADDSIGRMMDAIEDADQTENTIIVVVSDHGVQLPGAKTQLYDHATRSPLFVKWPGVTSSNTVNTTDMIASFDMLPTFADMIGEPIPAGVDGRSFAPIIKGQPIPEWRDYIYKQQNDRNKMRAVQTREWLYIYNPWSNGSDKIGTVATGMFSWQQIRAATNAAAVAYADFFEYRQVEELYNVANDPHCLTNLFDSPAYAAEQTAMQDLMLSEMITCGDTLVIDAFINRTNAAANAQFVTDQVAFQNAQADNPYYTRDVFFDPHDGWRMIDYTIFEPYGEWGIWQAEGDGVSLNASKGHALTGNSCLELSGGRAITSRALDTSMFNRLKIDARISSENITSGNTLSFQYNDGTGWHDFQTLQSNQIDGNHSLIFERPEGGLPEKLLFGIKSNLGADGRIYLDQMRFTADQDWSSAPADSPFDATGAGIVLLSFEFEAHDFSNTDHLAVDYFNGSDWTELKTYDFSYVLLTNKTYSDQIDLEDTEFTFPSNLEFRFRSEPDGKNFTISNLNIQTRAASDTVEIVRPPEASPDTYSETGPKAIVVPAPGILDNDSPGSGDALNANLISGVTHGILELNIDGSLVYAATNGYTGADSFTYSAVNSSGASTSTVSLTIFPGVTEPVIFFDDFESGNVIEGGWVFDDGAKSTNYMAAAGYNSDYGANQRKDGAITKTVSTVGFSDIQLKYWRKGNSLTEPTDSLVVEWSTDGSTWTEVENTNDENWAYSEIDLPPQAAEQPALSIRFRATTTLWSHKAYFDDILIQGTPASSGSTVTSFSEWSSLHGVTEADEYLMDYAYNLNPHLSRRYPLTTNGNSGLPVWEAVNDEEKLSVEFIRRKHAADLTYSAQFTDNLMSNWTDAVAAVQISPVDEEFERVKIVDSVSTSEATNRFGRIRTTR